VTVDLPDFDTDGFECLDYVRLNRIPSFAGSAPSKGHADFR
jgi:hypothetical protein